MLESTPIHAESARYRHPLVFLPDLWAPARSWRPVASLLAHRGWEGQLIELRGAGSLADRVVAVGAHLRTLPQSAVLIGHGAGGLVALEAARRGSAIAVALIAPLVPGSAPVRGLTRRWDVITALLRGRPLPPPAGAVARRLFREVPDGLDMEGARAVLDVVRGTPPAAGAPVPVLVLHGDGDPLLPAPVAASLAARLGADRIEIPGAGHWPLLPPAWQRTADALHRWLVRRLGEALLDYYDEAMAERDAAVDEPGDG